MTRERAKWVDQTPFWAFDAAGAPGIGAAADGLT